MTDTLEDRIAALRQAVADGSCARVGELLADCDEADRTGLRQALGKELAAEAKERGDAWRRASDAHWAEYERTKATTRTAYEGLDPVAGAGRLALVGIGTHREVEAALYRWRGVPDSRYWPLATQSAWHWQAGRVVAARRDAPWRQEAIAALLGAATDKVGAWSEWRLDFGAELLAADEMDAAALLAPLGVLVAAKSLSPAYCFRQGDKEGAWADPQWQRIVWAGLECANEPEVPGFLSNDWLLTPLLAAVAAGQLPRAPLIPLVLRRALQAARPAKATLWIQFAERLAPSVEEWAAARDLVLDLVAAGNPRAVGLGLNAARALRGAGALRDDELLPVLGTAVGCPSASVAKDAITLLRAVAKDQALRAEALRAALSGLTHPNTRVGESVVAWLLKEGRWRDDPDLVAEVAAQAESLAPVIAEQFRKLGLTPSEPAAPVADEVDLADLRARLTSYATERPGRQGWCEACAAALEGGALPPLPVPDEDRWRLDPPFPTAGPEDAAKILRVASAISARREWLEVVVAAARQPLDDDHRAALRLYLDSAWHEPSTWKLLRAWLGSAEDRAAPPNFAWLAFDWTSDYDKWRLDATLEALAVGRPGPPLCTPTHVSGWLDPRALAERLVARGTVEGLEREELALALWRLPPSAAARHAVWPLLAPVVGGFPAPVPVVLAAVFDPAADPARTLARVAPLRGALLRGWPKRLLAAARFATGLMPPTKAVGHCVRLLPKRRKHQDDPPKTASRSIVSSWAIHENPDAATFTLDCPALATRVLAAYLEEPQGANRNQAGCPRFLAQVRVPLASVVEALVAIGDDSDQELREATAEVLLAGLHDGRLTTQAVATALGQRLSQADEAARRRVEVLAALAAHSPVCRELAAVAAEEALARGLATGAGGNALLELLVTWRVSAGRGIEDERARARLAELATGKDRGAKLARTALDLPATAPDRPPSRLVGVAHDVAVQLELVRTFDATGAGEAR